MRKAVLWKPFKHYISGFTNWMAHALTMFICYISNYLEIKILLENLSTNFLSINDELQLKNAIIWSILWIQIIRKNKISDIMDHNIMFNLKFLIIKRWNPVSSKLNNLIKLTISVFLFWVVLLVSNSFFVSRIFFTSPPENQIFFNNSSVWRFCACWPKHQNFNELRVSFFHKILRQMSEAQTYRR